MRITSNRQYHSVLAVIESFIEKGFGNLSEKETERLRQTSLAVEIESANKIKVEYYEEKKSNKP